MDAISENSASLGDFNFAHASDVDEIALFGFGAELVAPAPAPSPPSTALVLPAAVSPPTVLERFQGLSQIEQAAVLAIAAAVLVAGLGWAIGAAKAASLGAAAVAL